MPHVREFGRLDDGTPVQEVTLAAGLLMARVLTWGAVLRDLRADGPPLVLGFNTLDDYRRHSPLCGAIVGRYGNRIRDGRFWLDGTVHQLTRNDGPHHLSGGFTPGGDAGFGQRPWRLLATRPDAVLLEYTSPDGEEGYPGALVARCRYSLHPPATLRLELTATTSKPTIVNLVHHSYFNLAGTPDVLDHELCVVAETYLPSGADRVPTGEIRPVTDSPFDFREPRCLRAPRPDGGFDHNFCLAPLARPQPVLAATLRSPDRRAHMALWTTEPGLQVYDATSMHIPVPGLEGRHYGPNAGVALEAQRWPDSPNHPRFPPATLRPGEVYRQLTEWHLSLG